MSVLLHGCAATDLPAGLCLIKRGNQMQKCALLPRKSKAWFDINSGSGLTCSLLCLYYIEHRITIALPLNKS